jgi:hypothetical protein
LAVWAASCKIPAPTGALFGDVAVADLAVGVTHLGVSPAQAHSLRAVGTG